LGGGGLPPSGRNIVGYEIAARLTGGGHNAFSRTERGEVTPLPTVVNLFRLLDKHPELLKDLVCVRRHSMPNAVSGKFVNCQYKSSTKLFIYPLH